MSYKFKDVSSIYGAPMGRYENKTERQYPVKFHLAIVKLTQGYDNGGAYWGIGTPLYYAYSDIQDMFIRASSRKEAKQKVLKVFPNAKFYR